MQVGIISYGNFNNRKVSAPQRQIIFGDKLSDAVRLNRTAQELLRQRGQKKMTDPKIRKLITSVIDFLSNDSEVIKDAEKQNLKKLSSINLNKFKKMKKSLTADLDSGDIDKQKKVIDNVYALFSPNSLKQINDFWSKIIEKAEKLQKSDRSLADHILDITKIKEEDILNGDTDKIFHRLCLFDKLASKENIPEISTYCHDLAIRDACKTEHFLYATRRDPKEFTSMQAFLKMVELKQTNHISYMAEQIYKKLTA